MVIVVAALALRIGAALILGDTAQQISGAYDQISYDTLAVRLLSGHGFSFPTAWYPFTQANEPTAHWSYLYPLYLAGVYAIFGHHPLVARLLQILLALPSLWLVYRIGRRLFGEWVGLVSAALSAGYAYFIFFNAVLMTQTFYILAVLAALDLALILAARPDRRNWILLGLSLGLGGLLRQTLLLFAPILYGWLAAATRRIVRWRYIAISIAALGLLILPWTIYNYFTFHDFLLLNSNGGYFLYASNHPNQGTHFNPNYVAPLPAELVGLPEPTIDRALVRQALEFITSDPKRFLLLTLDRADDYFWIGPSDNSLPISNAARVLSFTVYMPFMLYGLFLSRRRWRECMPLYLYILFDTILCLTSWSAPRYRLPSDAILMVFAGLAVVDLATRLAPAARRVVGSLGGGSAA